MTDTSSDAAFRAPGPQTAAREIRLDSSEVDPWELGGVQQLQRARAVASPRLNPPATPWPSLIIHAAVVALWILLFARAFTVENILSWSAGLIYILYDTILIVFVFIQTLGQFDSGRTNQSGATTAARPTLAVVIAAHNEEGGLPATLRALSRQSEPAEVVIIADDGSTDGTATILIRDYGLETPPLGAMSAPAAACPALRWLRLPHGGKASALNAAIAVVQTDLVMTVDGDTLLAPGAIRAMRDAFAANASLVAATGVLTPICGASLGGRLFQWFQTQEYIRNFLSRYAWARMDSLLLISGAFASFRRAPVMTVGGFDPACLVEDYELIHRLRRHGALHQLGWTTAVVGAAHALTDAPSTLAAFLRQRRRWFGGFLETQYWYRDMVGNPLFGRLGLLMLPVKALDTFQPLYGLAALALLPFYLWTGRLWLIAPVGGVILAKIGLDFAFHLWSIHLYRRWVDPDTSARLGLSLLSSLAEPFTFQILRHTGALLGWAAFLTGERRWGKQNRLGFLAAQDAADQ
jgi:cellulose synthase/poly-beta-1,6-N-acetylglucosamine synthase-like glycosyltransferase